jgi:hypothetical protein
VRDFPTPPLRPFLFGTGSCYCCPSASFIWIDIGSVAGGTRNQGPMLADSVSGVHNRRRTNVLVRINTNIRSAVREGCIAHAYSYAGVLGHQSKLLRATVLRAVVMADVKSGCSRRRKAIGDTRIFGNLPAVCSLLRLSPRAGLEPNGGCRFNPELELIRTKRWGFSGTPSVCTPTPLFHDTTRGSASCL